MVVETVRSLFRLKREGVRGIGGRRFGFDCILVVYKFLVAFKTIGLEYVGGMIELQVRIGG